MKVFFVTAFITAVALVYGSDLHSTLALDYNGVRALAAQIVSSLKS